MKLEFSFPDKFEPLLSKKLRELKRQGISKSAFLSVSILQSLGVDAEMWRRRVPLRMSKVGDGAERDEDNEVRKRKPYRPGPDPEPDEEEEVEEEQDEVEPAAIPDFKPLTPISASPSPPENRGHEGRCSKCGASDRVFDSAGDKHEPLCGDCMFAQMWSGPR